MYMCSVEVLSPLFCGGGVWVVAMVCGCLQGYKHLGLVGVAVDGGV